MECDGVTNPSPNNCQLAKWPLLISYSHLIPLRRLALKTRQVCCISFVVSLVSGVARPFLKGTSGS